MRHNKYVTKMMDIYDHTLHAGKATNIMLYNRGCIVFNIAHNWRDFNKKYNKWKFWSKFCYTVTDELCFSTQLTI